MLRIWKRSPLLRLFVPTAVGVCAAGRFEFGILEMSLVLLILCLSWFVFRLSKSWKAYGLRHISGILFYLLFFITGWLIALANQPQLSRNHFNHHFNEGQFLQVHLLDVPVKKEKSYKVIAEVVELISDTGAIKTQGELLLYFELDSAVESLEADDMLLMRCSVNDLDDIKNPGEFDQKLYLQRKGIFSKAYVKRADWELLQSHRVATLKGWLIGIREKLLKRLKNEGVEGREYAVLAALVLGKTSDIDKELLASYSGAGAVHVLAVSGLHVALIYVLLGPVLSFVFPAGKKRWLKTLIPVVLLWFYAGLTGFSPSVLRAALMFSVFIVADNFQKENNIYNTMCASAFMLLVYDSNILFETGFQLSYLAVAGIVILQKRITAIYYSRFKVVQWAWKLTAVSVAAQLATLPFTLAMFGQFPMWFILTNILVIPLSTVILYAGLAFFALSWWSFGAVFLAGLSSMLTRIMNDVMIWMETLPLAVISGISISTNEFFLLCAFICSVCHWLFWKKSLSLLPTLFFLIALMIMGFIDTIRTNRQQEFCIHALKRGDAFSFISRNELWFIADSNTCKDHGLQDFHFKSFRTAKGIEKTQTIDIDELMIGKNVCVISIPLEDTNRLWSLCIVDGDIGAIDSLPRCDYYYLRKNVKWKFRQTDVLGILKEKYVVLAAGFSVKKRQALDQLTGSGGSVTDLNNGAFVLSHAGLSHF